MNDPKCLETLAIALGLVVFVGICIFGWIKGRARIRVTILVFGILVVWVLSVGSPLKQTSRQTKGLVVMELKFECLTCGQHLSATRSQIGMRAPCPNCNTENGPIALIHHRFITNR
jgi:hypothetical protein